MPAASEPKAFPCVWINGSSGLPLTIEPDEQKPNPTSPPIVSNGTPSMPQNPLENLVKNHLAAVVGSDDMTMSPNATMSPNTRMSPDTNPNHDENTLEVCPECHKVFKRKVYLQRHMEREHWSTAKVFKCDDCSYETKHQSNLSVHRRIHTGRFSILSSSQK